MAVIGEEALEVDRPNAVVALLEAYLPEKQLIALSREHGEVYAAEIDEVKSTSAHNEESLVIAVVESWGDIRKNSALVGELELTNACQTVVNGCGISQHIGIELNAAKSADALLLFLGLNGKYLDHCLFSLFIK